MSNIRIKFPEVTSDDDLFKIKIKQIEMVKARGFKIPEDELNYIPRDFSEYYDKLKMFNGVERESMNMEYIHEYKPQKGKLVVVFPKPGKLDSGYISGLVNDIGEKNMKTERYLKFLIGKFYHGEIEELEELRNILIKNLIKKFSIENRNKYLNASAKEKVDPLNIRDVSENDNLKNYIKTKNLEESINSFNKDNKDTFLKIRKLIEDYQNEIPEISELRSQNKLNDKKNITEYIDDEIKSIMLDENLINQRIKMFVNTIKSINDELEINIKIKPNIEIPEEVEELINDEYKKDINKNEIKVKDKIRLIQKIKNSNKENDRMIEKLIEKHENNDEKILKQKMKIISQIIIITTNIAGSAKKDIRAHREVINITIFDESEINSDLTSHHYAPSSYTKLSKKDLVKWKEEGINELDSRRMMISEPIVKYMDWKLGDIIRVDRKNIYIDDQVPMKSIAYCVIVPNPPEKKS